MISLEQKNVCNYCNKGFDWTAILKVNNGELYTHPQVEAQAFATGRVTSTNGVLIDFDVVATCPYCGITNKFSASKKI